MRVLNLDMVIADADKIDYSSCHIAVNFAHSSNAYSGFWDATKTSIFLRGDRVVKYPLMGLGEVANITSSFPRASVIRNAWRIQSRNDIHITYAQAYTPLTKPMDVKRPFHDHPFLVSYLLGREYVQTNKEFRHIVECTEGRKEFRGLCESIILKLNRATARFEVVVTSRWLPDILNCRLDKLADSLKSEFLLVQIPSEDVYRYSLAVVKELFDPLEACYRGALEGSGAISTMLLCESLSLLPSMHLRDMPYRLLRQFEITPFTSGSIHRERRIVLSKYVTITGGVLFVPRPMIERVFLPLGQVPARGRKQIIRMIKFLEELGRNNRQELGKKAASILVDRLLNQMVKTQLIPRVSVLNTVRAFVKHGGTVHSVISAEVYVRRLFNPAILPSHHRFRTFLRTAIDLTSPEELYPHLSSELMRRVTFVPRVIVHESLADISTTAFHILSPTTLGYVKTKARLRSLTKEELMPIMKAVETNLICSFGVQHQQSKQLTRYTPELSSVMAKIFREIRVTGQKATLTMTTIAVIEYAKARRFLPRSFSTRNFQRAHNFRRFTSITRVREVVNNFIVGEVFRVMPFTIDVVRCVH